MNPILKSEAGNPENQDCGLILTCDFGVILAVADGAGGRSGAMEAAVMAIDLIRGHAQTLTSARACVSLLQSIDQQIERDAVAGETTCAVAGIIKNLVIGASVGDSGIHVIGPTEVFDLTSRQIRKPPLGSGVAVPIEFAHQRVSGDKLLLATDGLLKYTSTEKIASTCRESDDESTAERLIELVRYSSGRLPDDVTVIVTTL